MPNVTLSRRQFKGWSAWSIRRGELELVLVPEIGGRIMGLLWRGHDLFFTQPEREGLMPQLPFEEPVLEQKRALGFPLWGGDKTWIAPQDRWNEAMPFLDLDSAPYQLEQAEAGPDAVEVSLTSRVCRETALQIVRTIRVEANALEWTVTHRMINRGTQNVEWEIWDVAMVQRPARVFLLRCADSLFPGGVCTYALEGASEQVRERVVGTLGSLATIDCRESVAFKYGVDAGHGLAWLTAVIEVSGGSLVGYRKQVPAFPNHSYSHGCVAEVYNSDGYPYLELELHGPLIRLRPGEHFELVEQQRVFDVPRMPRSEADVLALGSPPGQKPRL